jgi:transposase
MEPRQPYPTDLTDREWELIQHLVPTAKAGGRPETYPKREILNARWYLARSGCAWRLLPHDFPPWPVVDHYFRAWRDDGTWEHIHDLLRGDVRVAAGKPRQPSAGIIASQAGKTTEKGGSTAMINPKMSTGASAISSSTREGCSWPSWSPLPVCKTAMGRPNCWSSCAPHFPECG